MILTIVVIKVIVSLLQEERRQQGLVVEARPRTIVRVEGKEGKEQRQQGLALTLEES
jgi:hypothetical protein